MDSPRGGGEPRDRFHLAYISYLTLGEFGSLPPAHRDWRSVSPALCAADGAWPPAPAGPLPPPPPGRLVEPTARAAAYLRNCRPRDALPLECVHHCRWARGWPEVGEGQSVSAGRKEHPSVGLEWQEGLPGQPEAFVPSPCLQPTITSLSTLGAMPTGCSPSAVSAPLFADLHE